MLASVIIGSKNESDMLRKTIDSIRAAQCAADYEIIVVDDGSEDGSSDFLLGGGLTYNDVKLIRTAGVGLAPARNLGAALAQGEIFVFCDAHITVQDYWLDHLARALTDEGADAVCPVIKILRDESEAEVPEHGRCGYTMLTYIRKLWLPVPKETHEVPLMCGGCFAVKRSAFQAVGGYQPSFRSYAWDEEDISIKLWTFGYTVMTTPHTAVAHKFRKEAPYPILWECTLFNLLYMAMCHYSDKRIARLMEMLNDEKYLSPKHHRTVNNLYEEIFTAENKRIKQDYYRQTRVHDDDWFFAKNVLFR